MSGKSGTALRELAQHYLTYLNGQEGSASDTSLSDLAWTASTGRSHFPHRAGLVFSDSGQLRQRLQSLVDAHETSDRAEPHEVTRVAFAYTGHGAPWASLVQTLYRTEPVVRAVLDRCDEVIGETQDTSLLDLIFAPSAAGQDPIAPAWAYPATYAIQCALAFQWASLGIHPSAVVAHGTGGLAAAHASGVVTLEEGLRLAASLGALRKDPPGTRRPKPCSIVWKQNAPPLTLAPPSIPLISSQIGGIIDSVAALGHHPLAPR